MEKQGVIKQGVTPPEDNAAPKAAEKQAQVVELDNDFRKRAAESARLASK
jgi:hypothetical protein